MMCDLLCSLSVIKLTQYFTIEHKAYVCFLLATIYLFILFHMCHEWMDKCFINDAYLNVKNIFIYDT